MVLSKYTIIWNYIYQIIQNQFLLYVVCDMEFTIGKGNDHPNWLSLYSVRSLYTGHADIHVSVVSYLFFSLNHRKSVS